MSGNVSTMKRGNLRRILKHLVLIYSVLLHKINIAVRSSSNAVSKRYDNKHFNLCKQKDQRSLNDGEKQSRNIT